eukprot:gene2237-33720_t
MDKKEDPSPQDASLVALTYAFFNVKNAAFYEEVIWVAVPPPNTELDAAWASILYRAFDLIARREIFTLVEEDMGLKPERGGVATDEAWLDFSASASAQLCDSPVHVCLVEYREPDVLQYSNSSTAFSPPPAVEATPSTPSKPQAPLPKVSLAIILTRAFSAFRYVSTSPTALARARLSRHWPLSPIGDKKHYDLLSNLTRHLLPTDLSFLRLPPAGLGLDPSTADYSYWCRIDGRVLLALSPSAHVSVRSPSGLVPTEVPLTRALICTPPPDFAPRYLGSY